MQEIIILAIVYYTSTLIVEQMVRLFGEFLDQQYRYNQLYFW